jgi:hypothetical protein
MHIDQHGDSALIGLAIEEIREAADGVLAHLPDKSEIVFEQGKAEQAACGPIGVPVPEVCGLALAWKAAGDARMLKHSFGRSQQLRRGLAKVIKQLAGCLLPRARGPHGIGRRLTRWSRKHISAFWNER